MDKSRVKKLFNNFIRPCQGAADENLAKGAGRALVPVGELFIALILAVTLNILNTSYANADFHIPYLSLLLSSDTISMNKPKNGGLVTGSHTVTVAHSTSPYSLTLSDADENTDMCRNDKDASCIKHASANIDNPSVLNASHWGFALPDNPISDKFSPADDYANSLATAKFAAVPDVNNPVLIRNMDHYSQTVDDIKTTIVYGVNIDNNQLAGDYSSTVQYTLTTSPNPAIISSLTPTTAQKSDTPGQTTKLTITGSNLTTAYNVYLQLPSDAGTENNKIACTNVTPNADGTGLTCDLPISGDIIQTDQAYNLYVQTQAAELGRKESAFTYTPGASICRNGDSSSDCQVDIDANMIPVKYVGNTTTPKWEIITNKEGSNNKGEWYDYGAKKWANAITLSDSTNNGAYCVGLPSNGAWWSDQSALCSRNGPYTATSPLEVAKMVASGEMTPRDDYDVTDHGVLGYWVYIPRYAYQVMRKEVADKFVDAQDFTIKFQKANDTTNYPKLTPANCPNSNANQYYQDCVGKQNSWATHPAFTFGDKELNGYWVGKFETTGSIESPTVLPGIASLRNQTIGKMFDSAKKIGVEDTNVVGGINSGATQNSHNLSTTKSHMLKNSEWGATAYLSASKYGAEVNNVQINGNTSYMTGCGTDSNHSAGPECIAYNTPQGQTASTTGNATGIYDMAGGAWEYTMGTLSTSTTEVVNDFSNYYGVGMRPPYVNLYPASIFTDDYREASNNQCTWINCGGHALHETKMVQEVSSGHQSWGKDLSFLFGSEFNSRWVERGSHFNSASDAGLFASGASDGNASTFIGFRTALATQ